jgi:hypothetical protein
VSEPTQIASSGKEFPKGTLSSQRCANWEKRFREPRTLALNQHAQQSYARDFFIDQSWMRKRAGLRMNRASPPLGSTYISTLCSTFWGLAFASELINCWLEFFGVLAELNRSYVFFSVLFSILLSGDFFSRLFAT